MIKNSAKIRIYRRHRRKAWSLRRSRKLYRTFRNLYRLVFYKIEKYYVTVILIFVLGSVYQAQILTAQSLELQQYQLELERVQEELARLEFVSDQQRSSITALQKITLVKSSDSRTPVLNAFGQGLPGGSQGRPPGSGSTGSGSTGSGSYRPVPKIGGTGSGGSGNPGGGSSDDSWNEKEFDQVNAEKETDPKVWSKLQEDCQKQKKRKRQTKGKQQCSASEVKAQMNGVELSESYESNKALKKVTANAQKSESTMRALEDVKDKIAEGIDPMQIGHKTTKSGNGYYYVRKHDARVILQVDPKTGAIDIAGVATRSNVRDMKKLANVANSDFNTLLDIDKKAY